MGSVASWKCWDAGSIPGPAQQVKDSAFLQLPLRLPLWPGSNPCSGNSTCCRVAKKEKRKKSTPAKVAKWHPSQASVGYSPGTVHTGDTLQVMTGNDSAKTEQHKLSSRRRTAPSHPWEANPWHPVGFQACPLKQSLAFVEKAHCLLRKL